MTASSSEIEVQALALPERERSALIARLLDSMDSAMNESPAVIARAWGEEIVRRVTEFEEGWGKIFLLSKCNQNWVSCPTANRYEAGHSHQ